MNGSLLRKNKSPFGSECAGVYANLTRCRDSGIVWLCAYVAVWLCSCVAVNAPVLVEEWKWVGSEAGPNTVGCKNIGLQMGS
ncbi:hypothetical protein PoB_000632300 [Plakobranchus ocellatus]|uniref:Uncharacterized protein n=1 Tax=Plakobranchus ocellatus TaxID=259542 RepID=A0AAV3YBE7_9GAST|nr:hypothetical protein PoB_000632300 [Plakobranchus ocellatus]